jgi:hypothetical protein
MTTVMMERERGFQESAARGHRPKQERFDYNIAEGFYCIDDGPYSRREKFQPYFKLHGSSNRTQTQSNDLMLIIGGNKAAEIEKQPLLKWYQAIPDHDSRLGSS